MRVKFGPWTPDQPDLDSGGLEEATNCLPLDSGYGALRGIQTLSGSVSCPRVVSSAMVVNNTGAYLFVGITAGSDGTQLGRFFQPHNSSETSLTFANVSRTASYSASLGSNYWDLTVFGSTVLAVNGVDPMQVGSTSTNFRDQSASASAPIASCLATVRDFVFAGNIASGGAGAGLNRVQWCQINNPLRWTPSPRLQSDAQDLPGSNAILAMTGGDFAAIFTERAIWRATYVGSPLIFRFDEVVPNMFIRSPATAARHQNLTFFLSNIGFQVFDGQQCIPIGAGVDRFALDIAQSHDPLDRVTRGIIDPVTKCYVVALRTGTGNGAADQYMLLVYSIDNQRWTKIDMGSGAGVPEVQQLTESIIMASRRQLTAAAASVPNSRRLEKRLGIGVFMGENSVNTYTEFISSNYMTATFATGEAQLFPDSRAFVQRVRPLIQGDSNTSVTVEVGKRNKLNESVSYTSAVAVNANGVCPVRADARYHRVRLSISGGFDRAIGFDLDAVKAGKR